MPLYSPVALCIPSVYSLCVPCVPCVPSACGTVSAPLYSVPSAWPCVLFPAFAAVQFCLSASVCSLGVHSVFPLSLANALPALCPGLWSVCLSPLWSASLALALCPPAAGAAVRLAWRCALALCRSGAAVLRIAVLRVAVRRSGIPVLGVHYRESRAAVGEIPRRGCRA